MNDTVLFTNGRVIDPANDVDEKRDLAAMGGVIVAPENLGPNPQIVDLDGLVLAPGLIDLHVHLRDPGQTHKEDIRSGTRAASAGGFTTVVAMPNTDPPIDSRERLQDTMNHISHDAVVHVLQAASLTKGGEGKELTDALELLEAGAVALTDDGGCIQNSALMLTAMREAATVGLPVIDHAEDLEVAADGVMHDGAVARQLNMPGKNRASEELMVARDIVLARETGCQVHIQHVSSAGSVQLIRTARQWGLPVSGEATPHHLSLTEDACLKYGTNAKMNPPLRTEKDRQAILQGVAEGVLSVIATDHAPHAEKEKQQDFVMAPFGILGLETALPICLTELYHRGLMSLSDLLARFTAGPREILGLSAGILTEGSVADIVVIDPEIEHKIDLSRFASKSRNCPYQGWQCKGRVVRTMAKGRWIYNG